MLNVGYFIPHMMVYVFKYKVITKMALNIFPKFETVRKVKLTSDVNTTDKSHRLYFPTVIPTCASLNILVFPQDKENVFQRNTLLTIFKKNPKSRPTLNLRRHCNPRPRRTSVIVLFKCLKRV